MKLQAFEWERGLGLGTLLGVVSPGGELLASLPPEARSALWGAIGAAGSLLLTRGASALGEVVTAAGRRWARKIDPEGAVAAKGEGSTAEPSTERTEKR